jgi:hypothetical protein
LGVIDPIRERWSKGWRPRISPKRRCCSVSKPLPWKAITIATIIVAEVAVLCLVGLPVKASSVDGLIVRPGSASIEIADQTGPWGVLVVKRVVTPVRSWVVVQARRAKGQPGTVLGYTQVPAGTSTDIAVALDPRQSAANTLVVSVFADRGRAGVFEYVPPASGGGGGMGMSAKPAQDGAAKASPTAEADKPLVANGNPVSAVVSETQRSGSPGTVSRVAVP